MTTQRKIIVYLCVFFLAAFVSYLLLSANVCPEQVVTNSTLPDAPDFISHLWPAPQSKLSTVCYYKSLESPLPYRGISVVLHPVSILDLEIYEGSTEIEKPFIDRVYLYIDKVQISNSSSSRLVLDNLVGLAKAQDGIQLQHQSEISSEYTFSWKPSLIPGHHVARIVIETKSGKVLEYQWDFTIW